MSRNPDTCPHNITDWDNMTGEVYCEDCGDVVDTDIWTQEDYGKEDWRQ